MKKTNLTESQRGVALFIAMMGYCVDCGKVVNRMSATAHVKKFHNKEKGTTMKRSKRSKRLVVSDPA